MENQLYHFIVLLFEISFVLIVLKLIFLLLKLLHLKSFIWISSNIDKLSHIFALKPSRLALDTPFNTVGSASLCALLAMQTFLLFEQTDKIVVVYIAFIIILCVRTGVGDSLHHRPMLKSTREYFQIFTSVCENIDCVVCRAKMM